MDDLLIDQILPQLGQRPHPYANQDFRWRKRYLADLFNAVSKKLSRASTATVIRIPRDGLKASLVEAVDDPANPRWRTVALDRVLHPQKRREPARLGAVPRCPTALARCR